MTERAPPTTDAASLRVLMADAIDYAGLFPPTELDMAGAVAAYASYLDSDDTWALGRFVVPASRLQELAATVAGLPRPEAAALGGRVWPLSAVFAADGAADVARVRAFEAAHGAERGAGFPRVEAVELRADTPEAIDAALSVVPDILERFVEIPLSGDVRACVRAIGAAGAYAKVRTGGTTPGAFPDSVALARFLAACVAENVPFKATAGLHHPVRGDYALTYAPDSVRGTMYGFLNVFLAAALLRAGEGEDTVRAVLDERDPAAFVFDSAGVAWRGRRVSTDDLERSRRGAVRSFGSCSFREPLDDLAAIGLL